MTGFLSTGLSALIGSRAALDVTGQNIANVNTPGYSRQRVNFVPQQPQQRFGGAIGNGVGIDGLQRFYDQFVFGSIVEGSSAEGRLATLSGYSDRINNLLADPALGVGPSIQGFFDALQDATADPASAELRQIALGQADALANRFNRVAGELDNINAEIDRNLAATVDEINGLTAEIADLNNQIGQRRNAPVPPNDLLDRRDVAVTELAALIGIETVEDNNGAINIVALPGNSLVTGGGANSLVVAEDPLDPTRQVVELRSGVSGASAQIEPSGGELGGLLQARRDLVDDTLEQLGRSAIALATTINAQSAEGLDLAGNFGTDIFQTSGAFAARPASANTGTGSVSAALADLGQLSGASYELLYNGSTYEVLNRADNSTVAFTGTGTTLDPITFDGVSVVVGGTPAAGDSFAVEPARAAAASLAVALDDPSSLAFAAPVAASSALGNVGTGAIAISGTTDVADPNLLATSTIAFIDANNYSINGAGSFAYTDGDAIVLNGTEFVISGQPVAGDQFTLQANNNAPGDNRNGLALAGLRDTGALDGGRTGVVQSYSLLVTDSGNRTRNFQASLDAQTTLKDAALREQQDVSGVDLDEEAANLVRFQQSYQAAAQLVAVANTLFDELIGAVRR